MNAWMQLGAVLLLVTLTGPPLGVVLARALGGELHFFALVERGLYRLSGVDPKHQMTGREYAYSVLAFSAVGTLALYVLLRVLGPMPPGVAFNTAVSFVTNTNWQAYAGETLSPVSQMLGLAVQNFLSAAAGIAVMGALIRGFALKSATTIGNFWVDLVRVTLYVLLPLSFVMAMVLVWQGVPQDAGAPVASQIAIKQLGTNGGGYYNANSAHPLENPSPLTNLLELWAILALPAACCFAFGRMVRDRRQGIAIYATMMLIFVPLLAGAVAVEEAGNPRLAAIGVVGGNMEGKEVRVGVAGSALWAVATTAASNGSVNAMHDSFMPLGGLLPLWLMQLGEVVFGGVGSGLYGMLMYVIIAVFIAGLMVGRTPEYLGKKIEAFEMKMASLVVLIPAACVLAGTAFACRIEEGTASLGNPGPHGFSEMLYAFSSAANNNGSAFGGLTASGQFYATATGIAMWLGRFWVIIPVLAAAGSLAKKKIVPAGAGTLPTHGPLFVLLLAGTIVLIGALTFVPALALGPIVEHLQLGGVP